VSDLNKEQIKFLSDHFGLTEEEVIQNSDQLKDTLFYQFQTIRETAIRIWNQLRPELTKVAFIYKIYRKNHNQKYYRKKKSQRKNWSKWKKRK
jgi:hypothetical protein